MFKRIKFRGGRAEWPSFDVLICVSAFDPFVRGVLVHGKCARYVVGQENHSGMRDLSGRGGSGGYVVVLM